MSYIQHYGFDREPFSNAPDSRFYYDSEQHRQALIRLMYAVDSNKGLAVLVGGVGTGKTTLARRMLDNLPESKYESSLLVMVHSGITPEWILTRIAMQLGVESPASDSLNLLKQLYDRLLQIDEEGRRAVVLIDEAQMLQTRELMEEFRGLLNLELPGKKLLNIVFFGLPELENNLQLDEPLAHRVAVKYHLRSLSVESTEEYSRHRIQIAGGRHHGEYFTSRAVAAIHGYSTGVPRLINTICDNCLFETFMQKKNKVDVAIVKSVAGDLGLLGKPIADFPQEEPEAGKQTGKQAVVESEEDFDEIDRMLEGLEQKA